MRCLLCGKLTFRLICKTCEEFIAIVPSCRDIDGFKVYGFFAYCDIAPLLHAKYSVFGSKIYAFLAKRAVAYLKAVGLRPLYCTLYASNAVRYAGKSLEFRQNNPRNFTLKRKVAGKTIVLVDDIVTTGLTLKEAKGFLEAQGAEVLCALVLTDVREC